MFLNLWRGKVLLLVDTAYTNGKPLTVRKFHANILLTRKVSRKLNEQTMYHLLLRDCFRGWIQTLLIGGKEIYLNLDLDLCPPPPHLIWSRKQKEGEGRRHLWDMNKTASFRRWVSGKAEERESSLAVLSPWDVNQSPYGAREDDDLISPSQRCWKIPGNP